MRFREAAPCRPSPVRGWLYPYGFLDMDEPFYRIGMAVLIVLCGLLLATAAVRAQEHDHAALGAAGEFYSKWSRPKGNFSGIGHRTQSCCNRSDCFPVAETRMDRGRYIVRPEGSMLWYRVDPAIIESNQTDPRESPDGRSHVCIVGGLAACFVEGGGI